MLHGAQQAWPIRHGVQAEAPAVFSPKMGAYFVMTSHLTGWAANPAMLFRASAETPCQAKAWYISQVCAVPLSLFLYYHQPWHLEHRHSSAGAACGSLQACSGKEATHLCPLVITQ